MKFAKRIFFRGKGIKVVCPINKEFYKKQELEILRCIINNRTQFLENKKKVIYPLSFKRDSFITI